MTEESSAAWDPIASPAPQAAAPGDRRSRVPDYLRETYGWAYLHPRSVWAFERDWVVNLILWGNMHRLTHAVLDALRTTGGSRTLQVACVYGQFSRRVAGHLGTHHSQLHLVDIAPIQLRNAQRKLGGLDNVSLHRQDAAALEFRDHSFENTVLFFLLHEQPADVRRRTIREALRVTRPGGRLVIVDYHRPHPLHPLKPLMYGVLRCLEPFALDLWREDLTDLLPGGFDPARVDHRTYFGGLYQRLVVSC